MIKPGSFILVIHFIPVHDTTLVVNVHV